MSAPRNRREPTRRQQLVDTLDTQFRNTVTQLIELFLDDPEFDQGAPSSPTTIRSSSPMLSSPIASPTHSHNSDPDSDSDTYPQDPIEENICQTITSLYTQYLDARRELLGTRILYRNPPVPKLSQLPLLWDYAENHVTRFVDHVRMRPITFHKILHRIEPHHVFHNQSQNEQIPCKAQLAITLFRLGHYGNAATPKLIGEWAGVSEGLVVDCTRRVLIALLDLHDEAIYWPDDELKERAKAYTESKIGLSEWRGGYLATDGSPSFVFQKPRLHGEVWYDKSGGYSTNMQVSYILQFSLRTIYAI